MFRRKYGFTITITHKNGYSTKETPPIRCWTEKGARFYANKWLDTMTYDNRWAVSVEVKKLPPVIDYYANRYWNTHEEYIGPEDK